MGGTSQSVDHQPVCATCLHTKLRQRDGLCGNLRRDFRKRSENKPRCRVSHEDERLLIQRRDVCGPNLQVGFTGGESFRQFVRRGKATDLDGRRHSRVGGARPVQDRPIVCEANLIRLEIDRRYGRRKKPPQIRPVLIERRHLVVLGQCRFEWAKTDCEANAVVRGAL